MTETTIAPPAVTGLQYQFVVDEPMYRKVCEAQGWKTATSVATAMGVPVSTVTRVLNGQVAASGEFIASFAIASGFQPGVGFRVQRSA